MRTLTTALLALLAGAGTHPLSAQHARQFELGAFGSYTRYDRAFGLDNQLGGGPRLGYPFGRVVAAGRATWSDRSGSPCSRAAGRPPTRTRTACRTSATPAPTRRTARPWTPGDARRTPIATASRTASTSAPTRRPARRWTPPAVRSTRIRTASPTAWTSVPARPAARRSTPRVAPTTGTPTGCRTVWISAPTRRPGRWWTPQAARSTATRTASPTVWTSAPTPRPAPRWTPSGAPGSRTRTPTAWTTRRINAPARPPGRA